MSTPEELRAAADAFASVGKPSLRATVDETMADVNTMVGAILNGDTAEADRLKAKLGVDDTDQNDGFYDDDEDEEEEL